MQVRGDRSSGSLAVVAMVMWKEKEREREGGCRLEGRMSGSRPGDGADSSGSGDVEKGGKKERKREK